MDCLLQEMPRKTFVTRGSFRSYNGALKFIRFSLSTTCGTHERESDISLESQRFKLHLLQSVGFS